ncbi:hypothetical protein Bca101_100900 [Brassica carinata]
MVHRKSCRKSRRKVAETVPPSDLNPSIIVLHQARDITHTHSTPTSCTLAFPVDCPVIFATRTVHQYTYQHAGPSRGLSVGDFRHEDCPWVIFATRTVRLSASTHISTLTLPADCPVIFATRTVRQYAYQHAGPSRGLSVGDFRHEDCPWVIFATRTVRQHAYQHAGPSHGLSERGHQYAYQHAALPVDYPRVIFATRTVRQDAYQHAGPYRGLSGDFRHEDSTSVHISARWPFPWTIRGDFRHEDCPWVIFATRTVRQDAYQHADPSRGLSGTVRQYAYQHAGPSRGLSVVIFATRTVRLSVGDFRHDDCPPDAYQHAGPSRGLSGDFCPRGEDIRLSVGDFCHEDCPWVIFATRTVRLHAYQHADPSRGLSGCYSPRGLSASTHISTLALPVDCPVIFATRTHDVHTRGLYVGDICKRGLSVGDFRHEDCPPVSISARCPFPWTVRVLFAHEDSTSVQLSSRWPFPWSVRVIFAHEDCRDELYQASCHDTRGHNCERKLFRVNAPARMLLAETCAHEGCISSVNLKYWGESEFHQMCRPAKLPPDNVLRSIDREASLGSKRRGCYPPPIHGHPQGPSQCFVLIKQSDSLVRTSSELAVRRPGKLPKEPLPVRPPADTRRSALATLAAQAARQQSTGSELGPPSPALRANPFPEVTDPFCRLPLPTLFHRPEAVHLGDLMRYEYDRRERTRSSGFSRAGMHRHHATRGALPAAGPYLRLSRFQGGQASFAPIPKSDERFARQYRCGPPPEFPLASPRSGIVHHLSGPDRHAHTRTLLRKSRSVGCAPVRDPANQLPYALRVYSPVDSHTCQTPWSVFQDGSNGEPTGRRPSTQMPRHAVRRVLQTTTRQRRLRWLLFIFTRGTCSPSVSPIFSLDGIYRPIGAAFPNNPTRRQRLRGATGSGHDGLSPSLAPLSRELGPGPSLRTLPDYTNAKTPDFQAGLFPLSDQTIDDLTRIEFTTACQDALASLARILANRAVTHGDQLPSDILERMGGRRFVTPRQTCPRPEGLGRNLRSKTRWFTDSAIHTKYRISPRSSSMRAEISAASRFRLYIAALPPTNTASGLAKAGRLVECSLTLFVRGLVISGSYAYNPTETEPGDKRITTELVGKKSDKKPAHRELCFNVLRTVCFQVTTMILPQTANHPRRRDPTLHRIIQSVGATGGVYKGQGRSQRELMTRATRNSSLKTNNCNDLSPSR